MQDEITREFARRSIAQHGSKIKVPDEYTGFKFPLHALTKQAYHTWSDVDLVLNKLPPRTAKDALMRTDGIDKYIPLHDAAYNAPREI